MKHKGLSRILAVLICLLPLLVACGGGSTASAPTATSAPVATAAPTAVPEPTAIPEPTATPEPTAEPTPEPGKPLTSKYMNFGIVNHLYYTDRERVLALTEISGLDWIRQ